MTLSEPCPRQANGWTSDLALNESLSARDGRPRSNYGGRVIVRGSVEEQEYLKAEQDQTERRHQQALVATQREQDLQAAKIAADAALQKERATAAAAEVARKQKEISFRQAAKEKQLAALSQAFASGDAGKRRAAISAALASGDEDQILAAVKDTLLHKDVMSGVLGAERYGEKVQVGFSIRIMGFDTKTGNFRATVMSPAFGDSRGRIGENSPGSGTLDGSTLAISTDYGISFQGRFDGKSKFVGRLSVTTLVIGGAAYSTGTYAAEVSIF